MKNKLWDSITIFETSMSAAEWAWRLITLLFIGGSSAITAFFASDSPFFKTLGMPSWLAVGFIGAICVSLILYLIKAAQNQTAMAEYTRSVSQPKSRVNPLLHSFEDQLIPVEELRLPGVQIHENKHFKRCSFVGPAAIVLLGGTFVRTTFYEAGDVIPVPDNTFCVGIVGLKNCTLEDCEFFRTTIITAKEQAEKMVQSVPGLKLAGK